MLKLILTIGRRCGSFVGVTLVLWSGVSAAASNWILRTEWKCNEGIQDPSLEYFDSKQRLMNEIEDTRKKYSRGGILQYAPCKPVQFIYWFEPEETSGKVPADAESVDANLIADLSQSKPSTSETSKTGKGNRKWVMWLEQFKEGKWSAVPDRRFEYLEADGITEADWQNKLKAYENAVESENKKNIQQETLRQQRGQAVKPSRYRVKWSQTEGDANLRSKSQGKDVVGDYRWGSRGSYDGFQEISLKPNGVMTLKAKGQGDSYREWNGKWTITSEGWIQFTDGRHLTGEDWDEGYFSPWIAWKLESSSLTAVYLAPKDPRDRGKPVTGWKTLERN